MSAIKCKMDLVEDKHPNRACGTVLLEVSLVLAPDDRRGIVIAVADCEALEIVGVLSISPAAHGIGLCDASFAYHPSSSLEGC